jgi:hypothetical protein
VKQLQKKSSISIFTQFTGFAEKQNKIKNEMEKDKIINASGF